MLNKILAIIVLSFGFLVNANAAPGTPKIKYTMVMLNMDGQPNLTVYNSYNSYSQCVTAMNSIIPRDNADVVYSNSFAVWCTPSSIVLSSTSTN